MRNLRLFLTCGLVLVVSCSATCGQPDRLRSGGPLVSFIGLSGGVRMFFGGTSPIEIMTDYGYMGSTEVANSELFKPSPGFGLSMGVCTSELGFVLGFHTTNYHPQDEVHVTDALGSNVTLVSLDKSVSIYDLDLTIAYLTADILHARVIPMVAITVASAADQSFFQDQGRLFHLSLSVTTAIKLSSQPTARRYFALMPSVSYDMGREGKLPSAFMIKVGLGLFTQRR